jgi:hypothetical protein
VWLRCAGMAAYQVHALGRFAARAAERSSTRSVESTLQDHKERIVGVKLPCTSNMNKTASDIESLLT